MKTVECCHCFQQVKALLHAVGPSMCSDFSDWNSKLPDSSLFIKFIAAEPVDEMTSKLQVSFSMQLDFKRRSPHMFFNLLNSCSYFQSITQLFLDCSTICIYILGTSRLQEHWCLHDIPLHCRFFREQAGLFYYFISVKTGNKVYFNINSYRK